MVEMAPGRKWNLEINLGQEMFPHIFLVGRFKSYKVSHRFLYMKFGIIHQSLIQKHTFLEIRNGCTVLLWKYAWQQIPWLRDYEELRGS